MLTEVNNNYVETVFIFLQLNCVVPKGKHSIRDPEVASLNPVSDNIFRDLHLHSYRLVDYR